MNDRLFTLIPVTLVILLSDYYIFRGLSTTFKWHLKRNYIFNVLYWGYCIIKVYALYVGVFAHLSVGLRSAIYMFYFLQLMIKTVVLIFFAIDDVCRLAVWLKQRNKGRQPNAKPVAHFNAIPRSEFLVKAGLVTAAVPIFGLGIGAVNGLYDYRVTRLNLYLPNLPKKFDGLTLGQISDIHAGSLRKPLAVKGGVDMLMNEKPDLIFFTGDLVNDVAWEMNDYQDIFSKVKAPLGVYSVFGNHDYGDYSFYDGMPIKKKNHEDLIKVHKNMGWDLLQNENRRLKVDGEEIGILGCENWGTLSRFKKYGRMDLTTKNTDDLPVKLLLSHDPSHWDAEVRPKYPTIDATFAGHTHGMQFGVRTKEFQWSPIEYIYKEWAGLYREGSQQLYVNVGYGFLGYPGRVGILPEITIFTLKSGSEPVLPKNA